MITWGEFYAVMVAMVPLYVAMLLAYVSVRRAALFLPEQCAGINRFVAIFGVPLLCFRFIAANDPYKMNLRFIAADTLQKIIVLAVAAISHWRWSASLDWAISTFSLATIPSTLLIGVPLLTAMYGNFSASLVVQIVVLQCVLWHPILLFLYEYREAQLRALGQFPSTSRIAPMNDTNGARELPLTVPAQIPSPRLAAEGSDESSSSATKTTKMILITVWRKLIRNPNTYSSLAGLVWSLIAYRWHIGMPRIVDKSVSLLSDTGLGTAMFSLGLSTALQAKMLVCGNGAAVFAMALRFLVGPLLMAVTSFSLGLRGTILRIAIVQAALPQGIVTFVFAKEYDVLPSVLGAGVMFGTLLALPVTLLYYIILGL